MGLGAPAKIPLVSSGKSPLPLRASRAQSQGALRIVTNVGAGCDGRLLARLTSALKAYGEAVWFWHPDADAKLATMLWRCADDGGKTAGHREEHGVNRKTIAQGMPGYPGEPVVD